MFHIQHVGRSNIPCVCLLEGKTADEQWENPLAPLFHGFRNRFLLETWKVE